jgi:hypothetical protein
MLNKGMLPVTVYLTTFDNSLGATRGIRGIMIEVETVKRTFTGISSVKRTVTGISVTGI